MGSPQRVVYASAVRTATPAAVVVDTRRATALRVVIDATAITATPSVVCTIDAVDRLSGKFVNLLTSAAIVAVGTTVLTIGPRVTAAANLAANAYLGDAVRITMTHGDTDSITYTVAAHLIRLRNGISGPQ